MVDAEGRSVRAASRPSVKGGSGSALTGDAGAIAGVSGLRGALTPVRPPETPAKGSCRSAAILAQGIVHPDRPLRPGRLRCERRTCQHPSHNGEELKRRKADKQHDQRAFNRQAALPSLFQAMKVVNRRGPGNRAGRHDIAPNTCRMGFAVSACGSVCTRSPYLRCVARQAERYRLRRRAGQSSPRGEGRAVRHVADANALGEAPAASSGSPTPRPQIPALHHPGRRGIGTWSVGCAGEVLRDAAEHVREGLPTGREASWSSFCDLHYCYIL